MAEASSAITALPPMRRWSLRCRAGDIGAIGTALGLALPDDMCRSRESGVRAALHLGPDEWLLRAARDDAGWIDAIAGAATGPFSVVDISDRQVASLVAAARAEAILAAGCPLDLAEPAFPVGMCTRTVFAKAEILLWRRPEGFVVEYWRSFAGYVEGLLAQAAHDMAW